MRHRLIGLKRAIQVLATPRCAILTYKERKGRQNDNQRTDNYSRPQCLKRV